MARPRLGVGFEGTLYPAQLRPGEMPGLSIFASAPTMEGLVAAANRFNLSIYPHQPCAGFAAAIRAWLMANLERHFEQGGHRNAARLAIVVIDQIAVVHDRGAAEVDFTIDVGGFPRPEDLNSLAPIFESVGAAPLAGT